MKAKKEKNRSEDPNSEHQLMATNPPNKSLNERSNNEDGSSPPLLGGQIGHSSFPTLGINDDDGNNGIGMMINGLIDQPNASHLNELIGTFYFIHDIQLKIRFYYAKANESNLKLFFL